MHQLTISLGICPKEIVKDMPEDYKMFIEVLLIKSKGNKKLSVQDYYIFLKINCCALKVGYRSYEIHNLLNMHNLLF